MYLPKKLEISKISTRCERECQLQIRHFHWLARSAERLTWTVFETLNLVSDDDAKAVLVYRFECGETPCALHDPIRSSAFGQRNHFL